MPVTAFNLKTPVVIRLMHRDSQTTDISRFPGLRSPSTAFPWFTAIHDTQWHLPITRIQLRDSTGFSPVSLLTVHFWTALMSWYGYMIIQAKRFVKYNRIFPRGSHSRRLAYPSSEGTAGWLSGRKICDWATKIPIPEPIRNGEINPLSSVHPMMRRLFISSSHWGSYKV